MIESLTTLFLPSPESCLNQLQKGTHKYRLINRSLLIFPFQVSCHGIRIAVMQIQKKNYWRWWHKLPREKKLEMVFELIPSGIYFSISLWKIQKKKIFENRPKNLIFRRTTDSIRYRKPRHRGFDSPANEHIIAMYSQSSRKFHETPAYHTRWLHVRWKWFLDTASTSLDYMHV